MIQISRKSLLIAASSIFLGLFQSPVLAADDYPSRPIKLVVGFPAGGPTDIIGRVIGQQLAQELGRPVIIENNGGAGGTIGADNVARAAPDGYTLLVAVEAANVRALTLNPSVPYDPEKGFTYIRKVAKQRNLVVVNPNVPVSNIAELVAYLKARPGEVNFGGTFGATSQIGGALFDRANGTKMTFISYSGGAQPITDTLSGILQVGFFTEATVAQHVKAGTLKAIAVASSERSPAFPDLPTVEQAGGKPLDISPWFGIAGPANLPPELVAKIGSALDKSADDKEFQAKIATLGAVAIRGSSAESFSRDIGLEIAAWNKLVKDTGTALLR
jgi:tripartite-type tricarboxylate transporter receptor subunit TctC